MPGQGNTEGSGGSLACKQRGGSGRATCEGKAWEELGAVSERRKKCRLLGEGKGCGKAVARCISGDGEWRKGVK